MKSLLNQLPLTTLIIIYFFFCGGLYTYAFWNEFRIDPFNLIAVTDIPKSFVYPFIRLLGVNSAIVFFIVCLVLYVAYYYIFREWKVYLDENTPQEKKNTSLIKVTKLLNSIVFIAAVSIVIMFFYLWSEYSLLQAVNATAFIILPSVLIPILFKNFIVVYEFKKALRNLIFLLAACTFPLACYTSGILHADEILYSDKITIVGLQKDNEYKFPYKIDPAIKLIGFIGDKVAVMSIDNKNIFLINQSYYESIHLMDLEQFKKEESLKYNAPKRPEKDSSLDTLN